MQNFKAQAAIEWLTIFGVTFIAIIGAAYAVSLYVLPRTTSAVNGCLAQTGYICSNLEYIHTNANIVVTVGQSSVNAWNTPSFVFLPSSVQTIGGIPPYSFIGSEANTLYVGSSIAPGQAVTVYLPVANQPTHVPIGQAITGSIWVEYTVQGFATPQYAMIGEVSTRAV